MSAAAFEDHADLTEAERLELEATRQALQDVYGTTDNIKSFQEGEAMVAQARQTMMDAMQMLPEEQRKAYDEAMKECPHLVEIESSPERFLRACDYNPWKAAERLSLYWNKRKEIFGEERAFLKMDLSGDGAIPKDVAEAILNDGGSVVLPLDGKKRAVFYTDRSRLGARGTEEDARLMTIFYCLQTIFDSGEAFVHGYVVITTMDTNENGSNKKTNTPRSKVLSLVQSEAIPVPFRAMHIVVMRKRSFIESSIPMWLKMLERVKSISLRTVVHFSETKENLMNEMKQYFFEEENMPQDLGGKLDHDAYFSKWSADRMQVERNRYFASTRSNASQTVDRKLTPQEKRSYLLSEANKPMNDQNEDDKKDENDSVHASLVGAALEQLAAAADQARADEAKARKRRLDAIYQKKKREQRKLDFAKLKQELDSLQNENSSLKKEQALLESLCERATSLAQTYDGAALPASMDQIPPLQVRSNGVAVPPRVTAAASESVAQSGNNLEETTPNQPQNSEVLPPLQAGAQNRRNPERSVYEQIQSVPQHQQEQQTMQLLRQQIHRQLLQEELGHPTRPPQVSQRITDTVQPPEAPQPQQPAALNDSATLRRLIEEAAVQAALRNLQDHGQQNLAQPQQQQQQQQQQHLIELAELLKAHNPNGTGVPPLSTSFASPNQRLQHQQQQNPQSLHSSQPQLSGVTWSSSSVSFNVGSGGVGHQPPNAPLSAPSAIALPQQQLNLREQQNPQHHVHVSSSSTMLNFNGRPSTAFPPNQAPGQPQQQPQDHAPSALRSFLESLQRSQR